MWVADLHGGAVLRVDPATDTVIETVTVGPEGSSGPNWLGSGLGSIWVDIPNNGTVVRVSPVTNTIQATIEVPTNLTACGGFAVDTDAVWVSSCAAGTVVIRIDPTTNTVVSTTELGGYASVTLINGAPWVSVDLGSADSGYLGRIDPATNLVDRVVVPDIGVRWRWRHPPGRRGRVGHRRLQRQAAPPADDGVRAVTISGRWGSMIAS